MVLSKATNFPITVSISCRATCHLGSADLNVRRSEHSAGKIPIRPHRLLSNCQVSTDPKSVIGSILNLISQLLCNNFATIHSCTAVDLTVHHLTLVALQFYFRCHHSLIIEGQCCKHLLCYGIHGFKLDVSHL